MPGADAAPLVGYPWWVSPVGIASLVLIAAGLVWVWWWTRASHPRFGGPVKVKPVPVDPPRWAEPFDVVRARNLDHVAEIALRFESGQIDPRDVHLELAAVLREHVSSRIGQDVTALTVAELRRAVGEGPATATLYAYLGPSFGTSKAAPGTTRDSITAAYEVVQRW